MSIKSFFQITHLKQLLLLACAPIGLGIIESFYKYDRIPFLILLLLIVTVIALFVSFGSYYQITQIKHPKRISYRQASYPLSDVLMLRQLRWWMTLSFALATTSAILLAWLTTWWSLLPIGIVSLLALAYIGGPKPLWQTPMNEIIFCFCIGYAIPVYIVYSCAYTEIMNGFAFAVDMLWVCLPLIFALFTLQAACNSILAEHEAQWLTMVNIMGQSMTHKVMHATIFLACLMPTIAIYLHNMPWTILGMWVMYPKLYQNVQWYKHTTVATERIHAMIQNATIIVLFQILLVALGSFF